MAVEIVSLPLEPSWGSSDRVAVEGLQGGDVAGGELLVVLVLVVHRGARVGAVAAGRRRAPPRAA